MLSQLKYYGKVIVAAVVSLLLCGIITAVILTLFQLKYYGKVIVAAVHGIITAVW